MRSLASIGRFRMGSTVAALLVAVLVAGAPAPAGAVVHTDGETIHFRAGDGVSLEGRLYGSGPVGVVLSHQINGDLATWSEFATTLAAKGYAALAYDARGVCPGGDGGCSKGNVNAGLLWRDIEGATRVLRSRGVKSIVLLGASLGAEGSVAAASRLGRKVDGVIALSPSEGLVVPLDLDAERTLVRRATARKLFIVGRDDEAAADAVKNFFRYSRTPKTKRILPTAAHGLDLFASSQRATVTNAILRFLARAPH
jgi:pimeloyl-ACP methyl ester carboxylesterase